MTYLEGSVGDVKGAGVEECGRLSVIPWPIVQRMGFMTNDYSYAF
jgi:hypothetical protein